MRSVFVSYRRGDSEGQARALNLELVRVVGKDSVFMDVDSIALGQDFRRVLNDRLASCDLMLVLIGPGWLAAQDAAGSRRLDSATDLVRQEIAAALKRNIPVTPVLLQGAQMPSPEQLPDDIAELVYRNGFELGHSTWESDVSEMIRRLGLKNERMDGSDGGTQQRPISVLSMAPRAFKSSWALGTSIAIVIVAVAGVLFYQRVRGPGAGDGTDASDQQPARSSSRESTTPPVKQLAGFGTITIANLKNRQVEVYEQNSSASSFVSPGYAGTITPSATTLQVPAGTYKLKIEQVLVERIQVTSGRSIEILFGTISVPGLTRSAEVYEQNSSGSSFVSPGYAGTITPPETTLQVPAGTYKLKIANLFTPPVRVEAGQNLSTQ